MDRQAPGGSRKGPASRSRRTAPSSGAGVERRTGSSRIRLEPERIQIAEDARARAIGIAQATDATPGHEGIRRCAEQRDWEISLEDRGQFAVGAVLLIRGRAIVDDAKQTS